MANIPAKISSGVNQKYSVDRLNKFFGMTPKDDWRDRIKLEIGDSKVPDDFLPQVKIMRWDNEVNLSLRLKEFDNYSVATKTDKIKLITDKREVHFYDLPISDELQEGGYEFEIILKERPLTNKIEFSLNTKGLEFSYQPSLTQEHKSGYSEEHKKEIIVSDTDVKDLKGNVLNHRPENVVGAYAVYASENKINYVGGKEYKTGQVGMIYKPKIVDSIGNWVWGELNVDIENGILSVTIPNEFLDKAVYPVKHAAGLTFGYTTIGSSTAGLSSGYFYGYRFTSASGSNQATKLTVYTRHTSSSTSHEKGIIVIQSSLNILTNAIGSVINVPFNTPNWYDSTFSSAATLSASTDYFLGVIGDGGANQQLYYNAGTSNYSGYDSSNSYASPADLGSITLYGNYKYSIYATYEEASTSSSSSSGSSSSSSCSSSNSFSSSSSSNSFSSSSSSSSSFSSSSSSSSFSSSSSSLSFSSSSSSSSSSFSLSSSSSSSSSFSSSSSSSSFSSSSSSSSFSSSSSSSSFSSSSSSFSSSSSSSSFSSSSSSLSFSSSSSSQSFSSSSSSSSFSSSSSSSSSSFSSSSSSSSQSFSSSSSASSYSSSSSSSSSFSSSSSSSSFSSSSSSSSSFSSSSSSSSFSSSSSSSSFSSSSSSSSLSFSSSSSSSSFSSSSSSSSFSSSSSSSSFSSSSSSSSFSSSSSSSSSFSSSCSSSSSFSSSSYSFSSSSSSRSSNSNGIWVNTDKASAPDWVNVDKSATPDWTNTSKPV